MKKAPISFSLVGADYNKATQLSLDELSCSGGRLAAILSNKQISDLT